MNRFDSFIVKLLSSNPQTIAKIALGLGILSLLLLIPAYLIPNILIFTISFSGIKYFVFPSIFMKPVGLLLGVVTLSLVPFLSVQWQKVNALQSLVNKLKSIVCDISLAMVVVFISIMYISVMIEDNPLIIVSALLFSISVLIFSGYAIYIKDIKIRIPKILFASLIIITGSILIEVTPWVGSQIDQDGFGYDDETYLIYNYFFNGFIIMFFVFIVFDGVLWVSQFITKRHNQVVEVK